MDWYRYFTAIACHSLDTRSSGKRYHCGVNLTDFAKGELLLLVKEYFSMNLSMISVKSSVGNDGLFG